MHPTSRVRSTWHLAPRSFLLITLDFVGTFLAGVAVKALGQPAPSRAAGPGEEIVTPTAFEFAAAATDECQLMNAQLELK
ncbi:MAG: hypothetical protein WCQ89_24085 [Verrucomicrobiota bacterium]